MEAIKAISNGDRSAFGRRLGYENGAFVRQMLNGSRAITERTIRKIESLPGMRGWFSINGVTHNGQATAQVQPFEQKAASEIAFRYIAMGEAARRVVDLVLRKENESIPVWATRPLLSAVDTALAIAEFTISPKVDHPKRVRR